jgi:hypothetical protein
MARRALGRNRSAAMTDMLGQELVRDASKNNRYLTLDFRVSQEKYEAVRKENRQEYETIDQECEALTSSEREIGRFVRAGSSPGKGYL